MSSIINLSICLLLLCIQSVNAKELSIQLHVHEWCPPCRRAKTIFNKLQTQFPAIHFNTHEYKNKTQLFKNNQQSIPIQILPFPTIIFDCGNRFSYQNDLTLFALRYWIRLHCFKEIQKCNQKINDQLYHLAVQSPKSQEVQSSMKEIAKHPCIKICTASHANMTAAQGIAILRQTNTKTLYFDYFSQSIREYLITFQKMAIALIVSNKNTTKVRSFFQTFLSLKNYLSQKPINHTSHFGYQLRQTQKEQLLFLQLCINQNISKCYNEPSRKNQIAASQKMIKKLINFLDIPYEKGEEIQVIVGFRFKANQMQTYIYHNSLGLIDQKFVYWISQILNTNERNEKQNKCLWNSLTHRISENNIEDLQVNTFVQNTTKAIFLNVNQKIIFDTKVKMYHNQPKFTLCFEGQLPQHFYSNKEAKYILKIILAHIGVKQQQNTDL